MTNDTLALMKSHRSIRRFESTPIPPEHIAEAVRCAQMASTSSAVQAYSVIHVTDPHKLETLAELAGPQEKVKHCGAFFVLCADTRRHRLLCHRAGKPYFNSFEALLVAIADVSLFAQNMSLAFEAMHHGICYIGGIRNNLPLVIDTLGLPQGVFPAFGLCAGIPAEDPSPRPRLDPHDVMFENTYPDDDRLLQGVERYDAVYRAYLESRGAEPKPWSEAMVARNSSTTREAVGGVYQSQGAKLG
jgi:nitroreductase